ncbi:uncharacterized protein LOC127260492 [Andrographis paniculata]|uniref:uncharacterized protein LOC127260492 n=1 Tax=Andrographis paniculata TaxID=175694 RepID=UPI0021E8D712|nr:uncharacterized protein LOC127260492 [Andrographis paniculata]
MAAARVGGGDKYRLCLVGVALIVAAMGFQAAEGRSYEGVNPFCRTASYRKLCTDMVKGAGNWHEASANAMQSALELAKKLKGMAPQPQKLPETVPARDPAAQRNQVMEICKDNLDGVVDDLESSLEALRSDDVGTVRSHLSGALRTDCQDAMRESKMDFPFSRYLGTMKANIDNCLAVVMQN